MGGSSQEKGYKRCYNGYLGSQLEASAVSKHPIAAMETQNYNDTLEFIISSPIECKMKIFRIYNGGGRAA